VSIGQQYATAQKKTKKEAQSREKRGGFNEPNKPGMNYRKTHENISNSKTWSRTVEKGKSQSGGEGRETTTGGRSAGAER